MCVLLERVCCYIGFLLYTLVIRATDASSLLLSSPSGSAWIWSIMHAVAQNLLRFWYEGTFQSSCMMSRSCKHRNNDMRCVQSLCGWRG